MNDKDLNKHEVLVALKSYRDSMSEFDKVEMDYLIDLVDRDIELEGTYKIG